MGDVVHPTKVHATGLANHVLAAAVRNRVVETPPAQQEKGGIRSFAREPRQINVQQALL